MIERIVRSPRGFTLIEMTMVVLILGVLVGFATPKFTNAMREYRVSMASRQLTDLIQRAKTQAVSDNRKVVIRVDTAGNRAGLVVYDGAGNEVRTEYVKLPQDVLFSQPANVTAPMTGAPTGGSASFPATQGSTTVFDQQFNSLGFPVVASPNTINALYVGNGTVIRALTLTSVWGVRSWTWNSTQQLSRIERSFVKMHGIGGARDNRASPLLYVPVYEALVPVWGSKVAGRLA